MIVVDIETSGLHPTQHSILSIGVVDFDNQENCFYGECKLREGAAIDPEALKVNGFTIEEIKTREKSCQELLKEFLEWTANIKDRTLAGFSVSFDSEFLREHFRLYSLNWPFRAKTVDFHSIFYFYFLKNKLQIPLNKENISRITLDFVIDYFNLEKRQGFHNALEDAKLAAKAFSLLLNK